MLLDVHVRGLGIDRPVLPESPLRGLPARVWSYLSVREKGGQSPVVGRSQAPLALSGGPLFDAFVRGGRPIPSAREQKGEGQGQGLQRR